MGVCPSRSGPQSNAMPPPWLGTLFLRRDARAAPRPRYHANCIFPNPKVQRRDMVSRVERDSYCEKRLRRALRNDSPELTSEVPPGPRLLNDRMTWRFSLRSAGGLG